MKPAEPSSPLRLPPIAELNQLPREAFDRAIRLLFEAAPPLADGLFAARPYHSYEALIDHAAMVIDGLTDTQRIAVVNAHPRIGANAASVRERSALSYREQGYDSEAAIDRAEIERVYQELAELNREYEAAFGFRFVVFVNRRPKAAILAVLKERIRRTRDEELREALDAMVAIARDRLISLS